MRQIWIMDTHWRILKYEKTKEEFLFFLSVKLLRNVIFLVCLIQISQSYTLYLSFFFWRSYPCFLCLALCFFIICLYVYLLVFSFYFSRLSLCFFVWLYVSIFCPSTCLCLSFHFLCLPSCLFLFLLLLSVYLPDYLVIRWIAIMI